MTQKFAKIKVHVSNHTVFTYHDLTIEQALDLAWRDLVVGYNYGWLTWESFRDNVKVEEF